MKQKDILIQFGQKVKEYRLERKWSQELLAEKSGFHRTYIGMIERGERNISLKNIEQLCNTLNIKIGVLFNEIG
ncbi:MAG: helix-turn-helix transcriptional regulator [Candidatus Kapaibacterium sp.]|jgi:transcriptional regulator with XRE-family HTH domain